MGVRWPLPAALSAPGALPRRLSKSTVVWSWVLNVFRLASGLIILPLVLRELSTNDLGMYYVFLRLVALVPLVDFGFGPTIGRFVNYAMGGATSLQAQGVAQAGHSDGPNYPLLWQLLGATRRLYRYLTLAVLVVMGLLGTYMVGLRVQDTAHPQLTWLAWGVTLGAALFDIYANWWGNFLRGMNKVLEGTQFMLCGMLIRVTVAATLLLCGGGLLSLPVGTLIGDLLYRSLARRACLRLLSVHPAPARFDLKEHLRLLWPNTWRLGVQFFSSYLTVSANTGICEKVLGLKATAEYGLSVQLLDIAVGMASVWTAVKWPLVGQYRARHDLQAIQRVLWPRAWLQTLTFLAMALGLLTCGPLLIHTLSSTKSIVPLGWFACLALNAFLLMQFTLWTTLMSLGNRLPHLWPTVATNALSLALSLALIHFTPLGVGALVLGPLLAGSLFNYWYWQFYGARTLGTSLLKFLLRRPARPAPACAPVPKVTVP